MNYKCRKVIKYLLIIKKKKKVPVEQRSWLTAPILGIQVRQPLLFLLLNVSRKRRESNGGLLTDEMRS